MTPCEKLGYKVGDQFEVLDGGRWFKDGEQVTLCKDDGSKCPKFSNGRDEWYLGIEDVKPACDAIALQPGDYVSTKGMTEDQYHAVAKAFMAAGAESGEYPDYEEFRGQRIFGWAHRGKLYPNALVHAAHARDEYNAWLGAGRHLTIPQVLNATNAQADDADGWIEWHGGKCPVERGTLVDVRHRDGDERMAQPAGEYGGLGRGGAEDWLHGGDHPSDIIAYRLHKQEEKGVSLIEQGAENLQGPDEHRYSARGAGLIDSLKAKRLARDEAERAYQDALRAVSDELGGEFTLQDKGAQAGDVSDLPPEEWREGDLVECVSQQKPWSDEYTIGKVYRVWDADGSDRPGIVDDDDYDLYAYASDFRFHHRPA